jgi:hypothetical protein
MMTNFIRIVGKYIITMPLRRSRHEWKVTIAFDDKGIGVKASGSLRIGSALS